MRDGDKDSNLTFFDCVSIICIEKKIQTNIRNHQNDMFLIPGLANRFEEYPKLRELIRLKDELIEKTNTPPM